MRISRTKANAGIVQAIIPLLLLLLLLLLPINPTLNCAFICLPVHSAKETDRIPACSRARASREVSAVKITNCRSIRQMLEYFSF